MHPRISHMQRLQCHLSTSVRHPRLEAGPRYNASTSACCHRFGFWVQSLIILYGPNGWTKTQTWFRLGIHMKTLRTGWVFGMEHARLGHHTAELRLKPLCMCTARRGCKTLKSHWAACVQKKSPPRSSRRLTSAMCSRFLKSRRNSHLSESDRGVFPP